MISYETRTPGGAPPAWHYPAGQHSRLGGRHREVVCIWRWWAQLGEHGRRALGMLRMSMTRARAAQHSTALPA